MLKIFTHKMDVSTYRVVLIACSADMIRQQLQLKNKQKKKTLQAVNGWSGPNTHNVSHESYDLAHTELLFSSLYLLYKKYAAHSCLKQFTAITMQVMPGIHFGLSQTKDDKSWQPKQWSYVVQRERFKDGRCHSLAPKNSLR